MINRLAGSGPILPGNGSASPGPTRHMEGAMGVAPQAAPNLLAGGPQGQVQRMPQAGSSSPQGGPGGQPLQPPSVATLINVFHRTSYISSMLKTLLGKPDLKPRDVIDSVGMIVADGIMDPFLAAKYLVDMPTDPSTIRQWVAQHYASSTQKLAQVAKMLQASGMQQRRNMAQSVALLKAASGPTPPVMAPGGPQAASAAGGAATTPPGPRAAPALFGGPASGLNKLITPNQAA